MWPDSLMSVPFYKNIGKFIHSIDMPMFMFISGFLYAHTLFHSDNYNKTGAFLKNKAKRLMIPYILWGGVINCIFTDRYNLYSLLYGISHLWFLLALMMIFTIVHLCRKYWMNLQCKGLLVLVAIFFLVSPLVSKSGVSIFALSAAIYYLPAFFMGIFCAKYADKLKDAMARYGKQIQVLAPILLILQLGFCFMDMPNSLCNQLTKLFSILIIISLWMLCLDKTWKTSSVIRNLDASSMGIYILHHILLIYLITNDIAAHLMTEYWYVSPLLLFIFVLFASWALTTLINRSRYSKYIFG